MKSSIIKVKCACQVRTKKPTMIVKDSIQPRSISSWCSDTCSWRCMCHKCPLSFIFLWTGDLGDPAFTHAHHPMCWTSCIKYLTIYLVLLLVHYHMLCCLAFSFLARRQETTKQTYAMFDSSQPQSCLASWNLYIYTWTFSHSYSMMTTL